MRIKVTTDVKTIALAPTLRISLFIHIAAINCSSLPTFVNGIHHGKGCHAAVWRDGSPSKQYCVNDDKFPWWRNCCKWDAGECIPKWHPTSSNATSYNNTSLKPGYTSNMLWVVSCGLKS